MYTALLVTALRAIGNTTPLAQTYALQDLWAPIMVPDVTPYLETIQKFPAKTDEVFVLRLQFEGAAVKSFNSISKLHTQVILLGAGMNSLAGRLPVGSNITIWEVDLPDAQAFKIKSCNQSTGYPVKNAAYVPFDFLSSLGGLTIKLTQAGWNPMKPTLFVWMGVTYYLPVEAVDNMLSWINQVCPEAYLAFDYALEVNSPEAIKAREELKAKGEPIKFMTNNIEPKLAAHGFGQIFEQSLSARLALFNQEVPETDERRLSFVFTTNANDPMHMLYTFYCKHGNGFTV